MSRNRSSALLLRVLSGLGIALGTYRQCSKVVAGHRVPLINSAKAFTILASDPAANGAGTPAGAP